MHASLTKENNTINKFIVYKGRNFSEILLSSSVIIKGEASQVCQLSCTQLRGYSPYAWCFFSTLSIIMNIAMAMLTSPLVVMYTNTHIDLSLHTTQLASWLPMWCPRRAKKKNDLRVSKFLLNYFLVELKSSMSCFLQGIAWHGREACKLLQVMGDEQNDMSTNSVASQNSKSQHSRTLSCLQEST